MAAHVSESDMPAMAQVGHNTPERKRRRETAFDSYMDGKSRKAYPRLQKDIADAYNTMDLPPHLSAKVCSTCSQALSRIKQMFNGLKRGSDLRRRRGTTLGSTQPQYRNLVQNEWLRGNVFDSMGNYLFCQECVCCTTGQQAAKHKKEAVSNTCHFNAKGESCG